MIILLVMKMIWSQPFIQHELEHVSLKIFIAIKWLPLCVHIFNVRVRVEKELGHRYVSNNVRVCVI